jgi:hypothetical protein
MNAQQETYYYLTPGGWRHADAPDIESVRYEAWVETRAWRLPWSGERRRWTCLWADVCSSIGDRDALRARYPFPSAGVPTAYGRPK